MYFGVQFFDHFAVVFLYIGDPHFAWKDDERGRREKAKEKFDTISIRYDFKFLGETKKAPKPNLRNSNIFGARNEGAGGAMPAIPKRER